jgi:hypothetical protein
MRPDGNFSTVIFKRVRVGNTGRRKDTKVPVKAPKGFYRVNDENFVTTCSWHMR